MRSATQPYCNTVEYGCVSLRMRFFSKNFGTIKRILPGFSSPSHREGPGIEVDCTVVYLIEDFIVCLFFVCLSIVFVALLLAFAKV